VIPIDPSLGRARRSFVPDPLPVELAAAFEAVRARLAPLGHRVLFFNTTASTNDVALMLAAGGDAEGTVVIADEQTSGRGRLGRVWHSPPGSGLYASVILRPSRARTGADRATGLVTLAAGVALSEAVEEVTALRPDIKWPNDLLIGRRKLAGILAESASGDLAHIVLGYGINVGARRLPPDVDARATSLESELGRPVDRAALCAASVAALSARYRDLLDGRFDAILDAWRARSTTSRGVRVRWQTPAGAQSGVTDGIDDRGALLVRAGDRVERIVGGEVTWL
jgi:BirA family transcriptional regulator, biotin operon repressor / biotin---[acetyl-CoA-carboxylase] ligase